MKSGRGGRCRQAILPTRQPNPFLLEMLHAVEYYAGTGPGRSTTAFIMSSIPASFASASLLQAFLHACYDVRLKGQTHQLRVGQDHPEFDQALGAHDWAILTACNPRGRRLEDAENRQRQAALTAELQACGLVWHAALNRDPAGVWPDEPSMLVLDAAPETLDELARSHDQAALLAGRPGGPARLRLYGGGWPEPLPDWARSAD